MNYVLLLYLLSISSGALYVGKTLTKAPNTKYSSEKKKFRIASLRYNSTYAFIDPLIDTINNVEGLASFYQKLFELRNGDIQRVSVVQIGDSHIQPDLISREVRTGLQDFFGNAGRGLVFPYQVARTNGPLDIKSVASTRWQNTKISQARSPFSAGLTGFSLSGLYGRNELHLTLKPDVSAQQQSFDHVKLFVSKGPWQLSTINGKSAIGQTTTVADGDFETREFNLGSSVNEVTISAEKTKAYFFGASLEKKNVPGVLLHTIGVNGARYEQYNKEPLFWKQLPKLQADLYILSMGTNEAFYNDMTEEVYINHVAETIAKIKTINPNAAVLLTTTAESFKKGTRNPMIERLNLALRYYSGRLGIPLWDLYEITGGVGSSNEWLKNNLLQTDKIHYQQKAYSIQGALLFDALANGYNRYLDNQHIVDAHLAKTADR
ncbi:hypothetical protein H8S90_17455 [Olivibacter sp. SDN3]|uniref:GDSL-type esterase/lipase family protein n=1 Tax=Olivibacter sp. SDN3 TaxID=2764720 RepID=UPI0016518ADB|nr:GDSL-type esterase/lipase family protein [Olivibacter sp. SDN3]QNL48562.1 hypothetical protein H8S90_17455 [Olivibacter sp. SDN3]